MPRWDNEELNWRVNTYDNAPCHSCVYRDRGDIGLVKGGAKTSCKKYPEPRYSIGTTGKPNGILQGTKPCKFYKKEAP